MPIFLSDSNELNETHNTTGCIPINNKNLKYTISVYCEQSTIKTLFFISKSILDIAYNLTSKLLLISWSLVTITF